MRRFTLVATISAGLLFGTSCSKTEDTAPETRLFGSPPQIQNVALSQSGGLGEAVCDYTKILQGYLCGGGVPLGLIATLPTITVRVQYTELQFTVQVTDPDSVPGGQSDILLVSASYQKSNQGGTPEEISLVVLDDGSTNSFQYSQQGIIQEGCVDDPSGSACGVPSVVCGGAKYQMASNDVTANDGTFTRGFALVSNSYNLTAPDDIQVGTSSSFALNCIANGNHQFPGIAAVDLGQPVTFTIEAVDRSGNLSVWPTQPQGLFSQTSFSCEGDECGCCLLLSSEPGRDCGERPGLQGVPGSGFEGGVCIDLF